MQWHITNKCNLRCKHCYQDTYNEDELNFDNWKNILYQYQILTQTLSKKEDKKIRRRLTLTGGEPFVSKDFLKLLEYINSNFPEIKIAILTNGTLVGKDIARFLKNLNLQFVQVSVEGSKKTHDSIRGKGSFEKAITGIKNLLDEKIKVTLSFTAHKGNFREFKKAAKIARKLKVYSIWSDRLIPYGSGATVKNLLLTKEDTEKYIDLMLKEKNRWNLFSSTKVSMERALQFLATNRNPYFCKAGSTLITVDEKGNLMPCRRMPIIVGNLLDDNLVNMYFNDEVFIKLRKGDVPVKCKDCRYSDRCKGGLKCLSYAIHNDFNEKDPGCWIM